MAIGDSFSGLAADRARINAQRAANYFNAAASQRAAEGLDLQRASADRNYFLNVAQLQDQRAARAGARAQRDEDIGRDDDRYLMEYLTRRADTDFNRGLQLKQSDLNDDYFDLKAQELDDRHLDRQDAVRNQGAALASELGAASEARTRAAQSLAGVEKYMSDLKTSALRNPMYKNRVLSKLAETADELTAARRDLSAADYAFKTSSRQAANLGFVPDPASRRLIHAKTGRAWNLELPQMQPTNAAYFQQPTQPQQPAARTVDVDATVTPARRDDSEAQMRTRAVLQEAKNAILFGRKDPAAVKARLVELGIDPNLLGI